MEDSHDLQRCARRPSNRTGKHDGRPGAHVTDRDWNYSYDGLDRLVQADRGVAVTVGDPTAGMTSDVGSRNWGLDMLGNWRTTGMDTTGDGDFDDTNEEQSRTHNLANELEDATKAFESFSSNFTYDPAGNLQQEERTVGLVSYDVDYSHDAWNRLVKIRRAPNDLGVYEYNGLNWRTVRRTDGDTQTTGTDDERRYYYSASWQVLEERLGEDYQTSSGDDRIVQQVWGSRYIDDAVLRRVDRNADEDFGDPGDGIFFMASDLQFSVVAVLDDGGALYERVAYSPYGRAEHRWASDVDDDGDVDSNDITSIQNHANATIDGTGTYRADEDLVRDGVIDIYDALAASNQSGKAKLVAGWISDPNDATGPDNEVGYCGYQFDYEDMLYCVRFRHYSPRMGRWLERDQIGVRLSSPRIDNKLVLFPTGQYTDGMNIYEYAGGRAPRNADSFGFLVSDDGEGKGTSDAADPPATPPDSKPADDQSQDEYDTRNDPSKGCGNAAPVVHLRAEGSQPVRIGRGKPPIEVDVGLIGLWPTLLSAITDRKMPITDREGPC